MSSSSPTNPFIRQVLFAFRRKTRTNSKSTAYSTVLFDAVSNIFIPSDSSVDDMDVTVTRYKPESIASLCGKTKFSKKELQVMYRGFKQVRPENDHVPWQWQRCDR